MTKKSTVLITGAGGPSGEAAISALKQRGFTTVAVDMREIPTQADHFHVVPAVSSPEYLPTVFALLERYSVDWFFPTVQEELVLIADLAGQFRQRGACVFIGAPQVVQICNDKWLTFEFFRAHRISAPDSVLGGGSLDTLASLKLPLVSRPRVGRGGRGVKLWDERPTECGDNNIMWQSFLPGKEYDVLQVLHPDKPEELLVQQVLEKTVLRDGRIGNATDLIAVEATPVAELAYWAAITLGLTGPMDMDIRCDQDGTPFLLEINARIGAHTLKVPAVFDQLVALYRDGVGRS